MHFTFWLLRVVRWGGSYVIVLPRGLRQSLLIRPGDYLSIRIHAPYATMRRCEVEQLVPIAEIPAAALPPEKITRGTDAD